ncbi:MAG: MBL fold metallo-hydrolase, partial [Myxococcota bacterium]|nr:MBL fold metallo-hydrolase [Myxococcota bacterium]
GSCGYRITAAGRTVVYLTDTAPLARPGEGICDGKKPPAPEKRVIDAMQGADLVIMDTMFSWDEYLEKMTWGHAYPEYAVTLAKAAGARQVALFHHAPDASDDELDTLAASWVEHEDPKVFLAREGLVVDLEG